jgi:hypothetical protein
MGQNSATRAAALKTGSPVTRSTIRADRTARALSGIEFRMARRLLRICALAWRRKKDSVGGSKITSFRVALHAAAYEADGAPRG